MDLDNLSVWQEQLLDGAILGRIEGFEFCNENLLMTLELVGGRLACLEFRPGQPIVARVVA